MINLIKGTIWIAGLLVVSCFILGFFGYELNREYFTFSNEACKQKIKECSGNVIHQGIDNAECNFDCIEPKMIIKKKDSNNN